MQTSTILPVVAGAATLLLLPSANAAPVEWPVSLGGNGHFYEAIPVSEAKAFYEASVDAANRGGHLVHIDSADENAFVFSLIDSPEFWFASGSTYNGPLIGAYQPAGPDYSEPAGGW